jgi:hypothetical protein
MNSYSSIGRSNGCVVEGSTAARLLASRRLCNGTCRHRRRDSGDGFYTAVYYYYQFFDRIAFDRLCRLSWREFLQRWGSIPWAKPAAPTGDGGGSLRDFVAFFVEPEPSPEQVEAILARKTIRWTIQHSTPQFAAMAELMGNVPSFSKHHPWVGYFKRSDFAVLIAAMVDRYLSGRISRAMLWPVFKVHNVADVSGWLRLSRAERAELKNAIFEERLWRPIYRWQGPGFLIGEEWANCLGVADTRRLLSVLDQAWSENWAVPRLKDPSDVSGSIHDTRLPRFQDFDISREFTKSLRKGLLRLGHACTFFRWE